MRRVGFLVIAIGIATGLGVWLALRDGPGRGGADDLIPGAGPAATEEPPALLAHGRAPKTKRPRRSGVGVLNGLVVDPAGAPVSGVAIVLSPFSRRAYRSASLTGSKRDDDTPPERTAETTSGADGSFRFTGLVVGTRLWVEAQPGPPRYGSRSVVTPTRGAPAYTLLRVGTGHPLRVRVVDVGGHGVEARVSAQQSTPSRSNSVGGQSAWRVTDLATDTAGRLRLPIVPDGRLLFQVVVEHRRSARELLVPTPAHDEVLLPIGFEPGATVEGRIRDEAGRPIPGAQVIVTTQSTPNRIHGHSTAQRVESGAQGRYVATHLVGGTIQSIDVSAAGFAARAFVAYGFPAPAGSVQRIDVTLAAGQTISGQVVDDGGRPVAGVVVTPTWLDRMGSPEHSLSPPGEPSTTGANGHFAFPDLPAHGITLAATLAGYVQAGGPVPVLTSGAGKVLPVTLVLTRGFSLTGRVLGTAGDPAAGAFVAARPRVYGRPGATLREAVTREDGRFTLSGFVGGLDWRLSAVQGRAKWSDAAPRRVSESADLGDLRMIPDPRVHVSGSVRDASGAPLPGVRVVCLEQALAGPGRVTDVAGRFRLDGVEAGSRSFAVETMYATGRTEPVAIEVVPGRDVEGLVLIGPTLLPLEGQVLTPEGEPVGGIQIQSELIGQGAGGTAPRMAYAYAEPDGSFAFRVSAGTSYRVGVWSERKKRVFVAGNQGIRLTYDPSAEAARRTIVEGTVLDPDGRPVARAKVMLWYGPRRGNGGGALYANGRFRGEIQALTRSVDIEVIEARNAAGEPLNLQPVRLSDIDPEEGPVEIRLERGQTLTGRVVGPDGQGVAGLEVYVGSKARWPQFLSPFTSPRVRTDATGHFRALGLAPGACVVHVYAGKTYLEPEPLFIQIPAQDLTVRLAAGRWIEGTLSDTAGRSLGGVRVSARLPMSERRRFPLDGPRARWINAGWRTETDPTGHFRLGPTRPDVPLQVEAACRPPDLPVKLDLRAAETGPLTLVARGGVWIEGEVVDADGKPAGPLTIAIGLAPRSPGNPTPFFRSLRHVGVGPGVSAFRVGPVAPGRYALQASQRRGYPDVVRGDIEAPAADVRFVLPRSYPVVGRLVGKDVEGFHVGFLTAHQGRSGAGTDAAGAFMLQNAEDVAGEFRAWRKGDPRYVFLKALRPSAGPFLLKLTTGLSIAGRIEGLPRGKSEGLKIFAHMGVWRQAGDVREDGRFEILGLSPGTYDLEFNYFTGGAITEPKGVAAGRRDVVLRYTPR